MISTVAKLSGVLNFLCKASLRVPSSEMEAVPIESSFDEPLISETHFSRKPHMQLATIETKPSY